MKTIIAEGISPDKAFNNTFDFDISNNATKAFSKSREDIDVFAATYLKNYGDSVEGLGAYIVLCKPKNTPPKTKFKVNNFVNKQVRKWETIVNFVDKDEKIVLKYPAKGTTKSKSIARAKELSLELNSDIVIVLTKQVKSGEATIAKISPVTVNTLGNYYFFGIENNIVVENE